MAPKPKVPMPKGRIRSKMPKIAPPKGFTSNMPRVMPGGSLGKPAPMPKVTPGGTAKRPGGALSRGKRKSTSTLTSKLKPKKQSY